MSTDAIEPVARIPPDDAASGPERSMALCLSGGGYRAMLFHLGALWRLQELGFLNATATATRASDLGPLARISSVSGGSLTAGLLALNWSQCKTDDPSPATRVAAFVDAMVRPIRAMAHVNVAGYNFAAAFKLIVAIVLPGSVNNYVTRQYRNHLYGEAKLADIVGEPRFVINASNLQSGALWRFTKRYMWDWRVGKVADTRLVELAQAVSASSAFPPPLSPAKLRFREADYTPGSGGRGAYDLQRPPFTTRPMLTDGGVYDNLGLETAWKNHRTILVSDAGRAIPADPGPGIDWLSQGLRSIDIIQSQVRSTRVRDLIKSYLAPPTDPSFRSGCYWGAGSDISNYPSASPLPCPISATSKLAAVVTDLADKDDLLQDRLINWGYAICDVAVRSWLDTSLPAPSKFPYPSSGVG
ncbi:MAG TPA: patatin-like phospholipase family protein [Candidatus Acidoferrales bacterium]|nr:patatin-like phospholipase family protein [Candidatus Acidoferrales bacterium]